MRIIFKKIKFCISQPTCENTDFQQTSFVLNRRKDAQCRNGIKVIIIGVNGELVKMGDKRVLK